MVSIIAVPDDSLLYSHFTTLSLSYTAISQHSLSLIQPFHNTLSLLYSHFTTLSLSYTAISPQYALYLSYTAISSQLSLSLSLSLSYTAISSQLSLSLSLSLLYSHFFTTLSLSLSLLYSHFFTTLSLSLSLSYTAISSQLSLSLSLSYTAISSQLSLSLSLSLIQPFLHNSLSLSLSYSHLFTTLSLSLSLSLSYSHFTTTLIDKKRAYIFINKCLLPPSFRLYNTDTGYHLEELPRVMADRDKTVRENQGNLCCWHDLITLGSQFDMILGRPPQKTELAIWFTLTVPSVAPVYNRCVSSFRVKHMTSAISWMLFNCFTFWPLSTIQNVITPHWLTLTTYTKNNTHDSLYCNALKSLMGFIK